MATAGTAEAMATEMEVATATATVEETATVKAKANSARLAAIARGLSNRRRCLAVWPYAMALIVALVGPSAYAQQDRAVPGRSLEAALKAYCPGKNLEFLEQQVLDRAIQDFLREQAPSARREITDATTRGSTACNGASDGSCRSAVTLGVLRQRNLSDALARRMCELPYRCSDWFTCVAERSAPTPPPSRSAGDPALEEPEPPTAALQQPGETAARCPNPPRRRSWLLRCARARRWSGRGSVHHSRKARTRPILGGSYATLLRRPSRAAYASGHCCGGRGHVSGLIPVPPGRRVGVRWSRDRVRAGLDLGLSRREHSCAHRLLSVNNAAHKLRVPRDGTKLPG